MMQRLQCNVFMLSYRGYDITSVTFLYHFSDLQLYTLWIQTFSLHLLSSNKVEYDCRYGESDGYPSQKGIQYDAQVCWFLYVFLHWFHHFSIFADILCTRLHLIIQLRERTLIHPGQLSLEDLQEALWVQFLRKTILKRQSFYSASLHVICITAGK